MGISTEEKTKKNIYPRTCRMCGAGFAGGPRAVFCPDCGEKRKAMCWKNFCERKRAGKVRKFGTSDICEKCGSEYIVKGGLQKYCKNCGRVSRNIQKYGNSYIVYICVSGKRFHVKCTTDRAEAFRMRDLAVEKKKSGEFMQWMEEIKSLENISTRKKSRKKQERIIIGKTYENIMVLSPAEDGRKPKRYNCRCIRCGKIFTQNGQEIHDNQFIGCPECRENDRKNQRIKDAEKYIGSVFGELEVIGIAGIRKYNDRDVVFTSCRCSCGNVVDIPLNRLKSGQAQTCGHNRSENLKIGRTVTEHAHIEDTVVTAIDGRRKTNKNSRTGIKGVSRMQDGKYRAYINFQHKQYYLGSYENIDDAETARKIAEEKIYGPFLEWYAAAYPEQWEKIKKKEPGDSPG